MLRVRSSFIDGRPFVLVALSQADLRTLRDGAPLRVESDQVQGADVLIAAGRSEGEVAAQLARAEQSLPEPVP
ncbi:MAG TPA: hypothetical protein VGR63_15275 [Casimicrobiaceae bacterium]|nr:hypothetical protein [Casimicrobiaceae bacterium]